MFQFVDMISSIRIPSELEKFPQLVGLLSEFISLLYKRQVLRPDTIAILSTQMIEMSSFAESNLDGPELIKLQNFIDLLIQSNE